MKKKILSVMLSLALLGTSLYAGDVKGRAAVALDVGENASSVYGAVSEIRGVNFDAANIRHSGDIAGIRWGIDSSGVFAFYHSEETPGRRIRTAAGFTPYKAPKDVPWYSYRSEIKYVTLANLDSFISVGNMDYYFYDCQNLVGVVMLPAAASSMNATFYNDIRLKSFGCTMPVSRQINRCFQGCQALNADVVFTRSPDECTNAFYDSPGRVVVLPDIYDANSALANSSKCREYHSIHKQEVTLSGISRASGKLVSDNQSDSFISTIRYGQKLSDVTFGTTGGVRFAYAYGSSDFYHSVYLSADISRLMRRSDNDERVPDAGVYPDFMDVQLKPIPSSLASSVICPATFYRDSYKSLIVERCPLEVCGMSVSPESFVYDGTAKTPSVVVTNPYNGETLVRGRDYELSYQNSVNAGTARVTVTGIGNYTGAASRTYTIHNADLSDGVTVDGFSGTFDGGGHGIRVKVRKPSGGYTVKYGTSSGSCHLDASPVYTEAGRYPVYFQVSAPNYQTYTGSAVVQIYAKDIGQCTVKEIVSETYHGNAHEPEPVVSDGGKILVKNRDYTLTHSRNTDAGTAAVQITGIGNYTGRTEVSYKITAAALGNSSGRMELENQEYSYTGSEIRPKVKIWDACGRLLKETRDYTIAYSNAINAGTAKVQAVFCGNYKGSMEGAFEIKPVKVKDVLLTEEEFLYNGKEHCPVAQHYKEGEDYRISYRDNTDAGTALAVIEFCGNYTGTVTREFTIHTRKVTEELVFPEGKEVVYHEGLVLSEIPLTVEENERGRFEWQNPGEAAFVNKDSYTVRFIPFDTKNLDWSEVDGWVEEERAVVRQTSLVIKRAYGVLPEIRTTAVAEGDCLGDSVILWDEGTGKLSWSEPEQVVTPGIHSYSVNFIPKDMDNYDWSNVGTWDEIKGGFAVSAEVTVIANPTASAIREGELLSSSVLSSAQKGAQYEWESPDTIVTRQNETDNCYRVIYRYQGNVLVRKVALQVLDNVSESEKPVVTQKPIVTEQPVETGQPIGTKEPVKTQSPPPTGRPMDTQSPKESSMPVPTKIPPSTERPPEAETPDVMEPLPDMPGSVLIPEYPTGGMAEGELNAYEIVDRLVTSKTFYEEKNSTKKGIHAVKLQKISNAKIPVKWLSKRKSSLRLKRGKKFRFRIKGISKSSRIRWRSSNKAKLTVSKNGIVRTRKKGRVRLRARTGKKNYVCRVRIR